MSYEETVGYTLDEDLLENFASNIDIPELDETTETGLEAVEKILLPDFRKFDDVEKNPSWFAYRGNLQAVDTNKYGESENVRAYARLKRKAD
ncbi:MAG: hypothetical protein H8Z69_01570 [Nanohaloarchaea archaeon]|nr:hypothetical protein [Candidatus Nanohaloarchaea archaeon]